MQTEKKGITSVQAAALILSEGVTDDPVEAEQFANAKVLDVDEMVRAGLRRRMGFDFEVKQRPNKIFVSSLEGPRVRTHAKVLKGELDEYGNIISPALIDRLVDACVRLKEKWDEEQAE